MSHADDPEKLDPESFYTKQHLWMRGRLTCGQIEQATANGTLTAVDLRGPDGKAPAHGTDFLYKGTDVLAWLDAGAPRGKPSDKSAAASAARGGSGGRLTVLPLRPDSTHDG